MKTSLLVQTMMHQMHPDLFPETPLIKAALTAFNERDRMYERQNFWLSYIEAGLYSSPYGLNTDYHSVTIRSKEDYVTILEDETVNELAKIVQWANAQGHKIDKDYTDENFVLLITPQDSEITYRISADRSSVCRPVKTGNKVVKPGREAVPEQVVDEINWVCDKISFLAMETI